MGGRTTTAPIYGYKLDPDYKTQWVIDETAAELVRDIFDMYLNGYGVVQIARLLKEREVLRPSAYFGEKTRCNVTVYGDYDWHESTITNMLGKLEYCGDTVDFRARKKSYKSKKVTNLPKEEWLIFTDTHEAIITREVYEKAQIKLSHRRRHVHIDGEDMFKKMVFCHKFGNMMYIKRARRLNCVSYICSSYKKRNLSMCTSHYVNTEYLASCVLENIQKLHSAVKKDEKGFFAKFREMQNSNDKVTVEQIHAEQNEIQKRLAEVDMYVQGLFEAKVRREIDGDIFLSLSKKYSNEKAEVTDRLEGLILDEAKIKSENKDITVLETVIHKYDTISELTPEILHDFVERIEVEESEEIVPHRRNCRKIRVFFVGIGEYEVY